MKVLLARHLGFCFGVQRAMRLAQQAAARGPVATLGPLIHNRQAVSQLEAAGVKRVSDLEGLEGTIILRAHGAGPTVYEQARRQGLRIVDATCPFVLRARREAQTWADQGYDLVVVGDARHPEVSALLEWLGGKAWVVDSPARASELPPLSRVALVAQTTLRPEILEQVAAVLRPRCAELKVADTICTATQERQEATRELAREVDLVLVVGGRESANTRRLWEIAREEGCPAYLVEGEDDIQGEWLQGKGTVGIAAGASTPEWAVKEVVAKVQELGGDNWEDRTRGNQEEAASFDAPVAELVWAQESAETATGPGEGEGPEAEIAEEGTEAELAQRERAEAAEGEKAEAGPAEGEESEAHLLEQSLELLRPGDLVQGRVLEVGPQGVIVDVGYKSEGVIPLAELSRRRFSAPEEVVSPGEEITVYVLSVDNQEQVLRLSKKRADEILAWEHLREAKEKGEVIEAEAIQEVKGGLVVDVGLRGFVPASQIERGYVQDLSRYVGQTLRLKVIELDRSKNRAILSQRIVLEEERRRKREETWATIAEGQVRTGVVKSVTDFGAFIDVGGVDGLLHVSEMAWGRVNHPSEVVQEGQNVEVMVLRVDREKGKISLSLKQALADPWEQAAERYPVGSVVTGRITRLAPFGAFVELEPGVEGLVHLSELSSDRVSRVDEVLNVGEEVRVKVLRVRAQDRRIGLSLRQVTQDQERAEIKRFLGQQNSGPITAPLSTMVSEALRKE